MIFRLLRMRSAMSNDVLERKSAKGISWKLVAY